jgi:two-component system response regulator YesN
MEKELYKFLLADDEHIVRKGFSEKINWEKQGFEFLPPCSNGKEAIDAVKKHNPDIVLTDICMPQADGLEVSEYILENHPDTIVVILSGFDDFEYAQTALRNRVFDYILKTDIIQNLKETPH